MKLAVRPPTYLLPAYSLTGDLLGYLRCGLQYRYERIGQLPASRPVQQWFGEFIHGVLEESFRRYAGSVVAGAPAPPPWQAAELVEIRSLIKARLSARGLRPWNIGLEELGDARADTAVQELGPHLFPLIHRAEIRLTGTRDLPAIPASLQFRNADRYEMVGVVDVVTHVELGNPALQDNPIVEILRTRLGTSLPSQFEVIVDYKGMRRPPRAPGGHKGDLWTQYEWQVLTYGRLRSVQADSLPVEAGILLYLNELRPTRGDLIRLKQEVRSGSTDVAPPPGSEAEAALAAWKPSNPTLPVMPFEFRLARAVRVVPFSAAAMEVAASSFDVVVRDIETCVGRETHGASLLSAWDRNSNEEQTCVVCDWRTFCPDFRAKYASGRGEDRPKLPAERAPK